MFNLSFLEILLIVVVAVLAFGPRLPQVAAEAAHFMGRMRRSLADLRRETGIDREIEAARRALEEAHPSRWQRSIQHAARDEFREVEQEVLNPDVSTPLNPPVPRDDGGAPRPDVPGEPGPGKGESGESATPDRPGTDRPGGPKAPDPDPRP